MMKNMRFKWTDNRRAQHSLPGGKMSSGLKVTTFGVYNKIKWTTNRKALHLFQGDNPTHCLAIADNFEIFRVR